MGDFSNYEKQAPRSGQTVPYEVTELKNPDGTHPIVHIEHIGDSNETFVEEMLARAGADEVDETHAAKLATARDRVIRHAARRLERVFFSDGTQATDADIPGFVRALPVRAFDRMARFAMSEAPFVEIATDPQALAEK